MEREMMEETSPINDILEIQFFFVVGGYYSDPPKR
jgi:Kef-type K+ transport system membrane component KefB